MKRSEYVEIVRLAAACCDQRISTEEHERLQLLLRSDAAARRVYLEYVDLHARLGQHPDVASSPGMETGKSWLDEPRDAADGGVPTVAKVARDFRPLSPNAETLGEFCYGEGHPVARGGSQPDGCRGRFVLVAAAA